MRILKGCASGGPPLIEENLSQLKGKGAALAPGSRRSPFRAFVEYAHPTDPLAKRPSTTTHAKNRMFTYTLAFQCVVNIGVRGSELIRTRVVEAGALDVVVHVLERYLEEVERRKAKAEGDYRSREMVGQRMEVVGTIMPVTRPLLARLAGSTASDDQIPPTRVSTPASMDEGSIADESASSSGQEADGDGETTEADELVSSTSNLTTRRVRAGTVGKENEMELDAESPPVVDLDGDVSMAGESADSVPTPRPAPRIHLEALPSNAPPAPSLDRGLQYRDEDVLLSLQLLAYLSKYPHVRSVFHSPADECEGHELVDDTPHDHADCGLECTVESQPRRSSTSEPPPQLDPTLLTPALSSNIFSLVESFTFRPPSSDRFTPRHSNEVQYWAGVIMRNACRKDESRGGIRQCANMQCGVWEKFPREFAKCRRCRKAKYCSKSCQSKAWQFGHRYWCAKAAPKDAGDDGEGGHAAVEGASMGPGTSRSASATTGSTRQPRLARPSHHLPSHHATSRPSTSNSIDTEDDDEIQLPPTTHSARAIHPHRHSNTALPRGLDAGGEEVMDEHEVAQEMILGRVFADDI